MRQLCALLLTCTCVFAQSTPQELAEQILKAFEHASPQEFATLVPVADARNLVVFAVEHKLPRRPGLARVLHESRDTAMLLLSGYAGGIPNSGDETNLGRQFAGLYRAARRGSERWQVERAVPIDETGRLHSQRLDVRIHPGQALEVTDKVHVTAES